MVCLACVCLYVAAQGQYDYREVKGDLMHSRIYTLKNGLTVYLSVQEAAMTLTRPLGSHTTLSI